VLDELLPAGCHVTEQYTNNPIEADHGRLKSRLRPMRGLKRLRSARVICAGHAFIQNLRRGHYEFGMDVDPRHRLQRLSPNSCHHLKPAPPPLSLAAFGQRNTANRCPLFTSTSPMRCASTNCHGTVRTAQRARALSPT
jgi:hypothetical protein